MRLLVAVLSSIILSFMLIGCGPTDEELEVMINDKVNARVAEEVAKIIIPPGSQGPQGAQGERGEQGIQGERGEQGAQGERGEQGIQGERGEQGIQGEHGEQGIQGERGEQGIQGERGEQGVQGERGEQGVQGSSADIPSTLTVEKLVVRNSNSHETLTLNETSITWEQGGIQTLIRAFPDFIRMGNIWQTPDGRWAVTRDCLSRITGKFEPC